VLTEGPEGFFKIDLPVVDVKGDKLVIDWIDGWSLYYRTVSIIL